MKNREPISRILQQRGRDLPTPDPVSYLVHRTSSTGLEGNFSRQDQVFGMVKGAEMAETHFSSGPRCEFLDSRTRDPWTHVTQDQDLVNHLLTLYFTWQHSFFQSFPEKLFRMDMAAGRTKYCSSMLVNAICSAGCLLSTRPETVENRGQGRRLVDEFFDEAVQLLRDIETSSITTTASLYLISYVSGTKVRVQSQKQTLDVSVLTIL